MVASSSSSHPNTKRSGSQQLKQQSAGTTESLLYGPDDDPDDGPYEIVQTPLTPQAFGQQQTGGRTTTAATHLVQTPPASSSKSNLRRPVNESYVSRLNSKKQHQPSSSGASVRGSSPSSSTTATGGNRTPRGPVSVAGGSTKSSLRTTPIPRDGAAAGPHQQRMPAKRYFHPQSTAAKTMHADPSASAVAQQDEDRPAGLSLAQRAVSPPSKKRTTPLVTAEAVERQMALADALEDVTPNRASELLRRRYAEEQKQSAQVIAQAVQSRQEIVDAMSDRRARSDQLSQLYQHEMQEIELELGRLGFQYREQDQKRKELLALHRQLEVQIFQEKRKIGVPQTAGAATTSVASPPPASQLARSTMLPSASSSPIPQSANARAHYHEMNKRLDNAKSVSEAMSREIHRLSESFTELTKTREAHARDIYQLRQELHELQPYDQAIGFTNAEVQKLLGSSGDLTIRVPLLEKRTQERRAQLEAHKQDAEETRSWLMQWIAADDATIERWRTIFAARGSFSGGSSSSSSPRSKEILNMIPTVIRELQSENESLVQQGKLFMSKMEIERMKLQKEADNLMVRLQTTEEKVKELWRGEPMNSTQISASRFVE